MGEHLCPALLERIRGEYREMPELQLTVAQACRLWQIDQSTCNAVLEQLMHEDFLRQTPNGGYVALPEHRNPVKANLDEVSFVRRRA
jgi:hypothetical protein